MCCPWLARKRRAEESEEEGDDADDLFQLGERPADVIFHGFGTDAQLLCDFLMGESFIAAQPEDLSGNSNFRWNSF